MAVDIDTATIEIGESMFIVNSNTIDDAIYELQELADSYHYDNYSAFGFYTMPKTYSPCIRLTKVTPSSSVMDIYDINLVTPVTIQMSTTTLRIVRDALLGISPSNPTVTMQSGMFKTRISHDNLVVELSRNSESKMLEVINTVLGPIPGFNLKTYMCVVGDDSVRPLIEPILPYYGGKYIETTGHSSYSCSATDTTTTHHHYVFPSEQYASESYQKIHRLPGVRLAMTMYMLDNGYRP